MARVTSRNSSDTVVTAAIVTAIVAASVVAAVVIAASVVASIVTTASYHSIRAAAQHRCELSFSTTTTQQQSNNNNNTAPHAHTRPPRLVRHRQNTNDINQPTTAARVTYYSIQKSSFLKKLVAFLNQQTYHRHDNRHHHDNRLTNKHWIILNL